MTDDINKELTSIDDIDYSIKEVNIHDVLNEMQFKTDDDKTICKLIITNLENTAAKELRNMKTVSLPAIGQLRINPIHRALRDNKVKLSTMREILGKERYQQYVRDTINDLREKQEENDRLKLYIKRIRSNNKDKYDRLCKTVGRVYAELYLKSIYWFKEIPFSQEFEDRYKELKG